MGQRQKLPDVIGLEGSGLDTDALIRITTTWLDEYGRPLPDELQGFTGRLAKVVMDGNPSAPTLTGVGTAVAAGDTCAPLQLDTKDPFQWFQREAVQYTKCRPGTMSMPLSGDEHRQPPRSNRARHG